MATVSRRSEMTKATSSITIPVLLLGCGGVGRHLLHHIVACRDLHSKMGLVLRVVGVSDSRSLLLVDDVATGGFEDALLTEIFRLKSSSGSSFSDLHDLGRCQLVKGAEVTTNIIKVAGLLGKLTGLSVVDCTASPETVHMLTKVIDFGCCIILANKKPLTCTIEDYDSLISNIRRIRFESTVGAGLPIIASITRVLGSGDPIYRIIGSLSGTLGYVMSEIEDGKLLSEVVLAAKSLGYTEPDPRDDLSGLDVARKALILARLLGWRIDMDDIQVESLYPKELGPNSMSTEDFLRTGILSLDRGIQERANAASSRSKVLRYVCVIEGSRCQVGLQELPKDSPLGRLRGSDNVVEIYSRCYNKSPMVIQGAGAGNDTTAAGVLADIVDLQDLFH
ncbi:bifunctional aspartokinase/homoserine dehydrogenase 1-like isoform X1 [Zingiber officinale]|uniref:bifunctional aspartokinase/homoserine dehydrogenase 1-like isoform X1 n=1 Tax=Zingiber officinale TaxID=94328 RepID=UPI001C4C9217|nr:bifunctional aspartokinase/homoserine dehydrogenase 1-like isoform X1 [Zingiber officinale]